MNTNRRLYRMTLMPGVITLISMFLSALALTGIYHYTEPGLTMERNTVKVNFVFMLMFVALSLVFTIRSYEQKRTEISVRMFLSENE